MPAEATQLAELLTWSCAERVRRSAAALRARHLRLVTAHLNAAISDRMPGATADRLRCELSALAPAALMRVLEAPQTCFEVLSVDDARSGILARFLRSSILAERLREHGVGLPEGARPVWTALGDARFSSSGVDVAPRAGSSIVVDFESPYARRRLVASSFRPEFGSSRRFRGAERARVLDDLRGGMDSLGELSDAAWALVSGVVRTIMPRTDSNNPTFRGSSNRAMVGRINSFNPQNGNATAATASLVHESIHTYLYLCEQAAPLVHDERTASRILVESPWSGTKIHLVALIHATYVWYGLARLWSRPAAASLFAAPVVDYYRRTSARGFEAGRIARALDPHRGHIPRAIEAELDTMSRELA